MERFELSIECDYAFDDAFLLDLVSAWPQLRELGLAPEHSSVQNVSPSRAGLLTIVAGCPNLERLHLQFDATDDITEGLICRAMGTAATSGARSLNVGDSPITHPRSVAHFLALAFPEVEELILGDLEDTEEDRACW